MKIKVAAADTALTLMGLFIVALGVFVLGPAIETRFFPVYSKFSILTIRPLESGGSEVVFRYFKNRRCEPAGFMWFVGEPGAAFRQIAVESDRPTSTRVNRSVGENTSVPYRVDVAPDVLAKQGFASVYSNCHPFWVTRSAIYP